MPLEVLVPSIVGSTGLTNFLLLIVLAELLEIRTNVAKLFRKHDVRYTTFIPFKPSPTEVS